MTAADGVIQLHNSLLVNEATRPSPDFLYHLGLDTSMPLADMFGDVRFVVAGGSAERAGRIAERLYQANIAGLATATVGLSPSPIGKTERYTLYKVGCVLSVSHGIGQASSAILWHEVTKLLHYAGARDPVFIRAGTCGGLGLEPGTVVISTGAMDGLLRDSYTMYILGEEKHYPCTLDADLAHQLYEVGQAAGIRVAKGKTMATDCFYEGQGRLDGAICDYSEADKFAFLHRLKDAGAVNIEMESAQFAAFTHRLGIKAAVVCVVLVDRLLGDQVSHTKEQMAHITEQSQELIVHFIRQRLASK